MNHEEFCKNPLSAEELTKWSEQHGRLANAYDEKITRLIVEVKQLKEKSSRLVHENASLRADLNNADCTEMTAADQLKKVEAVLIKVQHKADQYDSVIDALQVTDGGKYRADTIEAILHALAKKDTEIERLNDELGELNEFFGEAELKETCLSKLVEQALKIQQEQEEQIENLQAEAAAMRKELKRNCSEDCGGYSDEDCKACRGAILDGTAGDELLKYVAKLEKVTEAANKSSIMNRYRDGISIYEVDQPLIDALASLNDEDAQMNFLTAC